MEPVGFEWGNNTRGHRIWRRIRSNCDAGAAGLLVAVRRMTATRFVCASSSVASSALVGVGRCECAGLARGGPTLCAGACFCAMRAEFLCQFCSAAKAAARAHPALHRDPRRAQKNDALHAMCECACAPRPCPASVVVVVVRLAIMTGGRHVARHVRRPDTQKDDNCEQCKPLSSSSSTTTTDEKIEIRVEKTKQRRRMRQQQQQQQSSPFLSCF